MKESNFKECLETNSIRKVTPDIQRAKSLIETATERLAVISEISNKNCNFVFEDYYTSLLEILQAIAFKKGFNILNHICLGYFLRDVLERKVLFRIFDDMRYKRNSLIYYGKRMDFEIAKQSIKNCKKIIEELKRQY